MAAKNAVPVQKAKVHLFGEGEKIKKNQGHSVFEHIQLSRNSHLVFQNTRCFRVLVDPFCSQTPVRSHHNRLPGRGYPSLQVRNLLFIFSTRKSRN